MEEIAVVTGVINGKLELLLAHSDFCEKCGACQKSEDGKNYLEVKNTINAKTGDKVLVKIEPSNLKISAILYGIPSAMFIVGISSGYFLYNSEISGFLTGFLFLLAAFIPVKFFIKNYEPKIKKMQGFDPTLVGLPKPEALHNKCSPHFSAGERSE
ncbi:MAG TPA: hypothetical protein DCX95_05550 [Elusimicrobia bacterium]|nr:hypothetical protein [Elusimicrobiota bacterium]